MPRIFVTDFIDSLTDAELKFLYYYNYETYLESSRKLIDEEMDRRNIQKEGIAAFTRSFKVEDEAGCKRCGSHKFLENTKKCAVCRYEPSPADYTLLETFLEIVFAR